MGAKITKELLAEAVKLRESGMSFISIGRKLGVSPNTIYGWISKGQNNKALSHKTKPTAKLPVEEIIMDYNNFLTMGEIANKYNTHRDKIKKILSDNGVKTLASHEIKNARKGLGIEIYKVPELQEKVDQFIPEEILVTLSNKILMWFGYPTR